MIANPLSALPAFLKISRGESEAERRKTAATATTAVGVIFLVVTWFGNLILNILAIKIHAFMMAGGLILLGLAFSMLSSEESSMKMTPEEVKKSNAGAIVPLAIPIIAGPGAISSLIVTSNQYPGFANLLLMSCVCLIVTSIFGVVLFFASRIENHLGPSGIGIFNRIGGLLLAAIAIQLLMDGALGFFPMLGES